MKGTVLPARQPYLGFQDGQWSLSHPPGAPMGKGAPGRGCISSSRGLFWRDRYMAGVSRPGSGQQGSEAQGLAEAHAQGSARTAGVVSARLHRGKARFFTLVLWGLFDDKQFTQFLCLMKLDICMSFLSTQILTDIIK